MSNPVVNEILRELVHEVHPGVAANLTPDQWAQIIALVENIVKTVVPILFPPAKV
jgi:hypothetical protein